ncbi:NUDIX domain-containing protein [Fulvimarina sp. 2208YS6-2-32]|uniref:NUDIX domain-containing protein n=1 Tax=Fulvimarina uroteuthidis TaxID=3098149 RepID=A0ABU5I1D9_9HYPH|nr:NUDIX domain-containing protein [Fulvimarina sp. 2208YS6-2-32]MDY8109189.1 NUDIX domain-containing protein [Fulvimarina sp. 2208YS6-2-32]
MILQKTVRRLMHAGFLLARPMTLGVRVAAFDEDGRVFLVRHTYVPGWYLPGGGVDPGETTEAAARREIAEEGNLTVLEGLRLVSVHFNNTDSRRDHVLLFRADAVLQDAPKTADREIAEAAFFAPSDLPGATTDATRRRLDELRGAAPPDPYW